MNKINLYYHTGSANHGCEAIVRGTHEILGGKLRLFSFQPEEDVKYKLNEIVQVEADTETPIAKWTFNYLLAALQYKIFRKTSLGTQWKKNNIFSKVIKDDIYLSIGGDNYTYQGVWELADYNKILQKKGAKTVLWGCSIDEELIPNLLDDLNRYDLIITRETLTGEALQREGVTTPVKLCPDPAFQLKINKVLLPPNFSPENTVGINLSPLILKYGNADLILKNFENLVHHIIENTALQIAFIPHVVVPGNDDRTVMKPIFDKFEQTHRVVWIDDYSCSDLKGFISHCRFFLGARTHATIAAYSTEVPTIAIGYSMKAKGIAKDIFGTFDQYVAPVQNFVREDELIKSFQWLLQNEQHIIQHYQKTMSDYKTNALLAAEFLKEI
ncbi:polysaccharide pyruvyl transferase family protein [Kaistella yonginensis]|uniref:polysaccharide pyruvyl transferase family protein n=1 Tax=Kaistella yonginensis TaxID=658267 RepID=UPI0025B4BAE9|nr:polysaccharide pyruvyl transferase family protein [Kaistella yonginensis]MDN3605683.1 polysaccharide pyruvyl transferase family protein [Kaistella yonginensis]